VTAKCWRAAGMLRAAVIVGLALAWSGCGTVLLSTLGVVALSNDDGKTTLAPAPTIESITPTALSHDGGQTLRLRGRNFTADTVVQVGVVASSSLVQAPRIDRLAPDLIEIQLPRVDVPHLATVDIVINSPVTGTTTFSQVEAVARVDESLAAARNPTNGAAYVGTLTGGAFKRGSLVVTDRSTTPQLLTDDGRGNLVDAAAIVRGDLDYLTGAFSITFAAAAVEPVDADYVPVSVTGLTLTNAAPTVLIPNVPSQSGIVIFNLLISDFEADEVDVVLEVGTGTGTPAAFSPIVQDILSGSVDGLRTDRELANFSVAWNSVPAYPGQTNNLRLRATVTDALGRTTVAISNTFTVQTGVVAPPLTAASVMAPLTASGPSPTVVDAGLEVQAFAAGDLVDQDGRPDLVACDTNVVGGLARPEGGRVALLPNARGASTARQVASLPDVPGATVRGPDAGGNLLRSHLAHPSSVATLDVDGDGDVDLVAADSAYGPNTPAGQDLLGSAQRALADAAADQVDGFSNARAHQTTYTARQAAGALDLQAGAFESAQAAVADAAPRFGGPSGVDPAAAGFDRLGWFVQDLAAAELDGGGGGRDLVIVHGIAQLDRALQFAMTPARDLGLTPSARDPLRGLIVVRKAGPGGLGRPTYLDPAPMGALPVQAVVADLTADAHVGGFPLGPAVRAPADGLPDVVVACAGDGSLTFYVQTAPASDPAVDAPEFFGVRVPLAPLAARLGITLQPGDVRSVATGDLDGDGTEDLAVVLARSRVVLLFVHDAGSEGPMSLARSIDPPGVGPYEGTLPPGVLPLRLAGRLELPSGPLGRAAIADFTGDGRADVLVPVLGTGQLVVHAGRGTHPARAALGETRGTPLFGAAPGPGEALPPAPRGVTWVSFGVSPFAAAAVDLDGDSRDEVILPAGRGLELWTAPP
jgi:hypothetical protein